MGTLSLLNHENLIKIAEAVFEIMNFYFFSIWEGINYPKNKKTMEKTTWRRYWEFLLLLLTKFINIGPMVWPLYTNILSLYTPVDRQPLKIPLNQKTTLKIPLKTTLSKSVCPKTDIFTDIYTIHSCLNFNTTFLDSGSIEMDVFTEFGTLKYLWKQFFSHTHREKGWKSKNIWPKTLCFIFFTLFIFPLNRGKQREKKIPNKKI